VSAQLYVPYGVAVNASGTVFIADQVNNRVRQVTSGAISTFSGSGTKGYSGDTAQAASAAMASPAGIAIDSSGNVYVADSGNNVIRKITTGGIISTIAGKNSLGAGFSGDGGAATDAQLSSPLGVAVDGAGAVYVVDRGTHRVRKIAADGKISTVAGNGGAGFSGDGLRATSSSLNRPTGVAVDAAGNLYIADTSNHRIRKVLPDGTMITVAGTGAAGYSGDLGRATSANLKEPAGIAVDAAGNLYIADTDNSRIRRVSTAGTITTIAGNGRHAYAGDGDLGTSAALFFPMGVAVDAVGNVYVADTQNAVVRQLTPIAEFSLPPTVSGVIGAGGFGGLRAVAPGSWIEIYGSDLAVTARPWSGTDFTNRMAPTILDGTIVRIGGVVAPIAYISGGQVNALVPAGLGSGAQTLTVTTLIGTSAPVAIEVDATQPGIFAPALLNVGGNQYAGAVLADGSYAMPAIDGIPSRPVRAGETITLYGIGFGPVTPEAPVGQIAGQASPIAGSLQVFIGGATATVTYAGLAPNSVGLYQINVTMPAGVEGDAVPLTFTFNGVAGRQSLFVAARN
jgi:uncharacterized protein (TIGR03437 family)